jgi:hypothetical protein
MREEEENIKEPEKTLPQDQVPKSLKAVTCIFFWGGMLSIISMIAGPICLSIGYPYVMINFSLAGIFGVWISDGLAHFQKKWRINAMAFLWIGVIFSLAAVTFGGININDADVRAEFSTWSMILIFSLVILFYVILGGWQLYVLYRKDVKSPFLKRVRNRRIKGLSPERYKPQPIKLPLRQHKKLIKRFAFILIIGYILFFQITPKPSGSVTWRAHLRKDPPADEMYQYAPYFAYGYFRLSDSREVPAFIVYSRAAVKAREKIEENRWRTLNYGMHSYSAIETVIEFEGKEIEVPVSNKPPDQTWTLREPSEPNVFLIKEDGTLERQPYIVKTMHQYDQITEDVIRNPNCYDYEKRIKEIAVPAE